MGSSFRSFVVVGLLCACCGGASETSAPPEPARPGPSAQADAGSPAEPMQPPGPAPAAPDAAPPTPVAPAGRVRTELGAAALAILEGATSIEVAPLSHRDTIAADARGAWPVAYMARFRIRGATRPVDDALANRLLAIVLDDASYDFLTMRRCARRDIVGFRFHRGDERADVVLGQSCEQVEIVATGADGALIVDWAGWYTHARDRITALVQEALPATR